MATITGHSVPIHELKIRELDIQGLKKRSEFLAVARGRKAVRRALIVQSKKTPTLIADADPESVRIGFTVTKRVGNSVVRNRVRRRMREAARQIFPGLAKPGTDYVLIGRAATLTASFPDILNDLTRALEALAKPAKRPHNKGASSAKSDREPLASLSQANGEKRSQDHEA